tara:strand:- start:3 stop:296 length:294 start_codon:yes stop_codon:yes gene_type:complete
MKKEKEIVIISGFIGFAIGVCSMMAINVDKEVKQIEKLDNTRFTIQENIGTCEDMIEWMNYDAENYADSTVFDTYIWNLEDMIEDNRNLLYTSVDTL